MNREMPHVYQNNKQNMYAVEKMHYCPVCNGYYGVPHRSCARRGGCPNYRNCACRYHKELVGEPRQGNYGWIVGE